MEEYSKNKEYPLGTIVNTKYGKTIVEKSDGNCGNDTCVFAKSRRYCGQCYKSRRKDNQYIYFRLLKEENMEKRNIQIDINTARKWYNSKDSFKEELALQAFTMEELKEPRLPKSWDEYNRNTAYNEFVESIWKYDISMNNLLHLLILRDIYRQGWKPDFSDKEFLKWEIIFIDNKVTIDDYYTSNHLFSFPTKKLAEQFLENFKEELEQIKELL